MATSIPDWRLPPGVTRGLWDYLHDREIARNYDASLVGSVLCAADVRFAARHFNRPGKLIDLGCGTGRLLLSFAQRGYWVLGVDLSEEMLKKAGERADEANVPIQLMKANLVQLASLRDRTFDYAACLFSTLGMIAGPDNRQRVLQEVYRLLRPGGRFVLHVHNRWFNFWDPSGRMWLLQNLWRALAGNAQAGDRLMPVHQGVSGLTLHLFTRSEAIRLLVRSGFKILEVQPVSLRDEGLLSYSRCLGWLRAYGFLLAAERAASEELTG
jgi:ubiquinone/menaquinone biosynthesis C-methylase UbiE